MSSDEHVDSSEAWTWTMMEPAPTEREKALRDRFVTEYLVDFDATLAASRVGFQHAFAKDWGQKFLKESYVQQRVQELQHSLAPEEPSMEEYNRKRIIAVLSREMHNPYTTGSARVAAASKLMSFYGMDAPTRIKQEVEHRGGVMMVPEIANIDEWEKRAMVEQQKLAEHAATDIAEPHAA